MSDASVAGDRDASGPRVAHPAVHPVVEWLAAYSWRLLAIGLAIAAGLWLTGQLVVVVVPVAVAALLTRALAPVAGLLRRHGARPALAAAVTLFGFIASVTAALAIAGVTVSDELGDLGSTVSEGVDDVTSWLVEDSPFDVSRQDVERWREQAGDAVQTMLSSGSESVVSGAIVAAEVVVGTLLALIVTFFFLKDGRRMVTGALRALRPERRDLGARAADRAWDAAGGYLRGAALLGVVEAVILGLTLLLVGGSLVAPVMLVTFLAAFVPIVGAVASGIIAVLVALVTAGTVPALIVAVVAIVVQQLDNDLLGPLIYGRAVRLHPLVVLLGIVAGGALFGFVGTFLAVPFLAVAWNVIDEVRERAPRHANDRDRRTVRPDASAGGG